MNKAMKLGIRCDVDCCCENIYIREGQYSIGGTIHEQNGQYQTRINEWTR